MSETNKEGITQKELAIYVGYCLGFVLLLFGTFLPIHFDQIWMSIIGGTVLVLAHISWESMNTRAVIVGKKEQGKV